MHTIRTIGISTRQDIHDMGRLIEFKWAGPFALLPVVIGQVRKEAATVKFDKCRRPGSPTLFALYAAPHLT